MLSGISQTDSGLQVASAISKANDDLNEAKINHEVIIANFETLKSFKTYQGNHLDSLLECLLNHFDYFFKEKKYNFILESQAFFFALNTIHIRLQPDADDKSAGFYFYLIEINKRLKNYEKACLNIEKVMQINAKLKRYYENVKWFETFKECYDQLKKIKPMEMQSDEILDRIYDHQIEAHSCLGEYLNASEVCELQLKLAEDLYNFFELFDKSKQHNYRKEVRDAIRKNKVNFEKLELDALCQAIENDLSQYKKIHPATSFSEAKIGAALKLLFLGKKAYITNDTENALFHCLQVLSIFPDITIIFPCLYSACSYYKMAENNKSESKKYLT